jgi:c-di-GMP-binding flagellar brake protein YcgR
MDDPQNRRRFTRVNVGEDHSARFRMDERDFVGLTLTNLSAGGCCVKVPAVQAAGIRKGTEVTDLRLVHPRLPSLPLRAAACWLLGRQPGRVEGFLLVGFEFLDISPQYQETLEAYVQELLRP